MTRASKPTEDQEANKDNSVSRRVADELHERIDQVADKGEEMERALTARGAQAHDKALELGAEAKGKARQLNHGLAQIAQDNPWAVVGGAVALGILIGALSRRR